MALLRRNNRTLRLKAVRLYLLAVLVATLVLLGFSVVSLYEQRLRARELSTANLDDAGERLAREMEGRIALLAEDCLDPHALGMLRYDPRRADSLEELARYREFFNRRRDLHPIAQNFFLFEGARQVFPRLALPPEETPEEIAPFHAGRQNAAFLRLLAEGEQLEKSSDRARAVQAYRQAEALPVAPRLRGTALYRAARALRRAGRETEAREALRLLVSRYGDAYDGSQLPFVLGVATSEDAPLLEHPLPTVHDLYHDLLEGRWELSAAQLERVLPNLESRLGTGDTYRTDSFFLAGMKTAAGIRSHFSPERLEQPNRTYPQAFHHQDTPYQVFMTRLPQPGGEDLTVGFFLSFRWLERGLIPSYARQGAFESLRSAALVDSQQLASLGREEGETIASFQNLLPYWKLRVVSDPVPAGSGSRRELWFMALSAVMFGLILALGLFLFIQVSWDIRSFQLRSDFVSGVSHEFKTPLSLIRLYSETLADDNGEFAPEDRKNYLSIIARESARLSRLINNVLDFSRREKNLPPPAMPEGQVEEAVAQVAQDFSDYLFMKGFELRLSIQPGLPPVRHNPEQVYQMVANLIDNARKYSGASRLIRLNAWREGDEVVVEVQDNGIGISAEEKKRIFDAFYRVPGTAEKGGCGLGLYLVAQVMKDHGGKVEAESEVGQGSRFRLRFPVAKAQKTRITAVEARLKRGLES
ncbi:MAG: HAMP domain-containing histidine kinase [Acidobacteria bacterium]|nr:HAMP domain-containing histidine kinase [Acidobacteriota bacterium]